MQQDNLETSTHFATAVYSLSKPNFLPSVLTVLDEAISRQKSVKQMDELYPVYMTENLIADPRLEEFGMYILGTAWNILNTQGYQMNDKAVHFHSLWGQEHHKTSSMDEHIHNDGAQIVGFYIVDCPENSPLMVFSDPRIGKHQASLAEADTSIVSMSTLKISYKPEVGKFYFTNSWLPHAFTRHNNEKPFKFIHFNLTVKDQPVQQATVI